MARNKIQLQEGMSLEGFWAAYGTEEQCREAVARMRWPQGFVCPACGNRTFCQVRGGKLYQCHACHTQTSLTSGTLFHATKLPLRKWFLAMHLLTQAKHGLSSLELGRQLGVKQETAWNLKHKLMQAMQEREEGKTLSGRVELDDAYLGGEYAGGKRGRGSENKTPFLAAVETDEQQHPRRVKLTPVKGFQRKALADWAKQHLRPGTRVVSDGLNCFQAVKEAGCLHEPTVVGKGNRSTRLSCFQQVNTVLGNLKTSLAGTYHSCRKKYAARYLAEFQYRFNRRFDLSTLLPRLLYVVTHSPPLPMPLLRVADFHG